ncbi:MAG: cytochrome c oxidase subunit 3 [Acidimicrobiales bacterium]
MTITADPTPAGALREAPDVVGLPREAHGSRSVAWWGMVLFILSEATLFALLFLSYFYLRFKAGAGAWPLGGIKPPSLTLPGIMTVVLLSSSIPMFWAEAAVKRDRQGALRAGLAASALLGLTFLALMALEYHQDLKEFTPRTNAYGSIFFTITGLHGIHVIIGLSMNAYSQVRAWLGHFRPDHHVGLQNAALYWHFVDGLWIFIMLVVYLSPHTRL